MTGALTPTGRAARVAATLTAAVLLLAGTLWGQDDHFPFGPFRMYSTAPGPDEPAADTRLEGVDRTGTVVVLTEHNSGIRRAELEGQMGRYQTDPSLLGEAAEAYTAHNPAAPRLAEVRIVTRWWTIHHARPTGTYRDQTVVSWQVPS